MPIDRNAHRFVSLKCLKCGLVYDVLMSCGDRLCPECSKRRFGVLINRHKDFLSTKIPGQVKKIELTLVNDVDLVRMLARLETCWKKLYAYGRKHWGWSGGFISIQTTNKGKLWHVHAHIFIEGDFVSQDVLSRVWLGITGDSSIVWIRAVLDPVREFWYLVRYITKVDEVLPEFHDEYNRVFHGRRLIRSFGTWYNAMGNDSDKEDFACPVCGSSSWVSSFEIGFFTEGARPLLALRGSSP